MLITVIGAETYMAHRESCKFYPTVANTLPYEQFRINNFSPKIIVFIESGISYELK